MGFLDFFGGGTPPKYVSNKGAFDQFGHEMDQMAGRYNGYVDAGNRARDLSMDQYSKLISNPNFLQDMISRGFSESPYQQYVTDTTQKRMNMNAANTGMLGSGAANRALSNEINTQTGQFMDNYINRGMSSYGQGLSGLSGVSQMGLGALGSQDSLMEQGAAARMKGLVNENQTNQMNEEAAYNARNRGIGNLLGLAGSIGGAFLGGPMGASIGSSIGNAFAGGSGGGGGMAAAMGGGQLPTPFSGGGTYSIGNWSY